MSHEYIYGVFVQAAVFQLRQLCLLTSFARVKASTGIMSTYYGHLKEPNKILALRMIGIYMLHGHDHDNESLFCFTESSY